MSDDARHSASAIECVSRALSEWIVQRQYERDATLEARYGGAGRRMWRTDVQGRLHQLVQAVGVASPELFVQSVAWSKIAFRTRGVAESDLRLSLECMAEVVSEQLPPSVAESAVAMIRRAVDSLEGMPDSVPTFLNGSAGLSDRARAYLDALMEARRDDAFEVLLAGRREGLDFAGICGRIVVPAMQEVGRLWHLNEVTIAEEHCCTAASGSLLARLFELELRERRPVPNGRTAVIASVGGDLHELGARVVSDLLELDGWRCIFLGANMPAIEVVAALLHHGAALLAVSASSNLSVQSARDLIAEVRSTEGLESVRVIVGGTPFAAVPELWRSVGADGSASDATAAVALAARLTEAQPAR
ncbi:MAG TPA: cobalamin-dependent protein [Phycisphaerales bacterium]|nr:cobalamin-dependent protein [Phycisphaerales bacterium]HMP37989.1 cobalamin-dependent protein [Phycisphaerales bacterium]